jgi:nitrous-oxide reductase
LQNAILVENMVWQYLLKAADSAIRAKDLLVHQVATPKSEAARNGEIAFNENGCSGCHVIGKVSSGPNLIGVLTRHSNPKKWVADFIKNPDSKFHEPYMKALIKFFNLRMPNQGVLDEDIQNIIEYFEWIDENADLF